MADRYLFPARWSRRDFLQATGVAAAGVGLARVGLSTSTSWGEEKSGTGAAASSVTIGEGKFKYALDLNWGKLPEGMTYGYGCAIVVDGKDRIIVTSRSQNPCVAIFSPEGELLETWAKDFADKIGYTTEQVAGTAHGLYWSKEGDAEYLYFTENAPGNRVYKTDMEGKILYELGKVEQEGPTSQKFQFDNPTDVAVAPNGDIYIVDGYGSQLVHLFDKDFKHKKTIGGKGTEHGKFNTCHGVWVSTLNEKPEVYIADRANDRLEVYSPDLEYVRTIPGVRKPCCFYQSNGHLFIPELDARVSVIDAADQFAAHLGDGKGVPKESLAEHPEVFAAPHALTLDSQGNLYILEWLPYGRVRKFSPAA
jgi:hypothetical protein